MLRREGHGAPRVGESRLPMAIAVIAVAAMNLLMPTVYQVTEVGHLLYPALILVLLLILVIADPRGLDHERRWARVLSGILIAVITLVALATALRVILVVLGDPEAIVALELLRVAVVLWFTINITFGLWYWYLDCGGPAARAQGSTAVRPSFAFPEQDREQPEGEFWYPQFVDYLALSFYTAMALGPADVSPLRHWAKLWMLTQALFSLCMIYIVLTQALGTL